MEKLPQFKPLRIQQNKYLETNGNDTEVPAIEIMWLTLSSSCLSGSHRPLHSLRSQEIYGDLLKQLCACIFLFTKYVALRYLWTLEVWAWEKQPFLWLVKCSTLHKPKYTQDIRLNGPLVWDKFKLFIRLFEFYVIFLLSGPVMNLGVSDW